MNNPVIKIVNATTGAEVVRPMNSGELEVYEEDKINDQAIEQENIEKAEARSAAEGKLLELGLTTEDLKALLG